MITRYDWTLPQGWTPVYSANVVEVADVEIEAFYCPHCGEKIGSIGYVWGWMNTHHCDEMDVADPSSATRGER